MSWLEHTTINHFGGGFYVEFRNPILQETKVLHWLELGGFYHFAVGLSKLHALLKLQQEIKRCHQCRRFLASSQGPLEKPAADAEISREVESVDP